jgi:molybdopterin converting factor small subunit
MKIDLLLFGPLVSLIGESRMEMENIENVKALKEILSAKFPEMNSIPYKIAVNRKIAASDAVLENGDEVALLPPYAGG